MKHFPETVIKELFFSDLLLTRAVQLKQALSNYAAMPGTDKFKLRAELYAIFDEHYQSLLRGYGVDFTFDIEPDIARFLHQYSKLIADRGVADIVRISNRITTYDATKGGSLGDIISRAHIKVYGITSKPGAGAENEVPSNSFSEIEFDNMLPSLSEVEDSLRNEINIMEAIDTLNNEGFSELVKQAIEAKVDDIEEMAKEKLEKGLLSKANGAFHVWCSAVERAVRAYRSAVAFELMKLSDPSVDIIARFDDFSAFMFLQLDLYPFKTDGMNSVEVKQRLESVIKKCVMDNHDKAFVKKVYQHLSDAITKEATSRALLLLSPTKLDIDRVMRKTDDYQPIISLMLDKQAKNLKLLAQLLKPERSSAIPSSIASRCVASYINTLLEQEPFRDSDVKSNGFFQLKLISAISEHIQADGLSVLAISHELNCLRRTSNDDGFDYLERLRPSGKSEIFAYSSPDTGIPLIRNSASTDTLGSNMGFAVKLLALSSGASDVTPKKVYDAFNGIVKSWKAKKWSFTNVMKEIKDAKTDFGRWVRQKLSESVMYSSDTAEKLMKLCGDISHFNLPNDIAELPIEQTRRLLELLSKSAQLNVLPGIKGGHFLEIIDKASRVDSTLDLSADLAAVFDKSVIDAIQSYAHLSPDARSKLAL